LYYEIYAGNVDYSVVPPSSRDVLANGSLPVRRANALWECLAAPSSRALLFGCDAFATPPIYCHAFCHLPDICHRCPFAWRWNRAKTRGKPERLETGEALVTGARLPFLLVACLLARPGLWSRAVKSPLTSILC